MHLLRLHEGILPWKQSLILVEFKWHREQQYKTDSTAFLFSLTNTSNTPLKFKVKSPEIAVFILAGFGPTFVYGRDLLDTATWNFVHMNSQMRWVVQRVIHPGRFW